MGTDLFPLVPIHAKQNAFKPLLAKETAVETGWTKKQLIALELERRLSLFDDAQKRIGSIKDVSDFKQERLAQFLTQQSKLVEQQAH